MRAVYFKPCCECSSFALPQMQIYTSQNSNEQDGKGEVEHYWTCNKISIIHIANSSRFQEKETYI